MAVPSDDLIAFPDALRAFPDVPYETLDTWRRRCPYVKRHRLWWSMRAATLRSGRRRSRVCVFRLSELKAVVRAYRKRDTVTPRFSRRGTNLDHSGKIARAYWDGQKSRRDGRGDEWILAGEASRLVGVSTSALRAWRLTACPFLGGLKLRAKFDKVTRRGAWRYRSRQIEELAAAVAASTGPPPGYVAILQVCRQLGCSKDTLRLRVPDYDRVKREVLAPCGCKGGRQYQTFIPKSAAKAFAAARRVRRRLSR